MVWAKVVAISCTTLSFESQTVRSAVQKCDARCHACDYVGEVTARFQMQGPILRPLQVQFKPWDPQ
jgi:hypothetical protein